MRMLFVLLFMLPIVSNAQVYKWVDENGQVHYGASPPDDAAQEMSVRNPQIDSAAQQAARDRLSRQQRWLDAREEEKRVKSEIKQRQANALQEEKQECAKLSQRIRDLRQGGVAWYEVDEAGERQYIPDKAIAQEANALDKLYAQRCAS